MSLVQPARMKNVPHLCCLGLSLFTDGLTLSQINFARLCRVAIGTERHDIYGCAPEILSNEEASHFSFYINFVGGAHEYTLYC